MRHISYARSSFSSWEAIRPHRPCPGRKDAHFNDDSYVSGKKEDGKNPRLSIILFGLPFLIVVPQERAPFPQLCSTVKCRVGPAMLGSFRSFGGEWKLIQEKFILSWNARSTSCLS